MKGIALKVTYNDGGADGSLFGFRGTCSNQNMLVNVRERRMTNCSDDDNPCRKFVDANFQGRRPGEPLCYEGDLFASKPFQFGCGMYHNGPNTGKPIPIHGVATGDIAFLTTLLPSKRGHERIIFGCFRVAREPRVRKGSGYFLESDGTMDVRLPDDVAVQMNFWRYFRNKDGSSTWATGLFRHLDEKQTDSLLGDLLGLLGDHPQRDVLLAAVGNEVQPRPVRRLPLLENAGFGGGGFAGGESEAHRKLKEYVAANPAEIGLPSDAKAETEFPYLCGDQVDVKFDLPDGTAAVVEIETIDGWTGAHQCIKYRALHEASLGQALGGGHVHAILVAHYFDARTVAFAQKYGIRLVRLQL